MNVTPPVTAVPIYVFFVKLGDLTADMSYDELSVKISGHFLGVNEKCSLKRTTDRT